MSEKSSEGKHKLKITKTNTAVVAKSHDIYEGLNLTNPCITRQPLGNVTGQADCVSDKPPKVQ